MFVAVNNNKSFGVMGCGAVGRFNLICINFRNIASPVAAGSDGDGIMFADM